jgi:Ser/Thr protein kinase RdoA (MazF antagonist)
LNKKRVECITLIHGDLLVENLFWEKEDVKHVFDFEKVKISSVYSELSRLLLYACFSNSYKKIDFEKAKNCIKGYESEFKINKKEFKYVLNNFIMKSFHGLWILEEIFLNNNLKLKDLFDSEYTRVKYLFKNKDKFANKILALS